MYAIVETGGKQYRLSKNDTVDVEKLETEPGKSVKLERVLLYIDGKKCEVGKPYLKNVKVKCEVLSQTKGRKLISFKYKRRKSSRTKVGHRQALTRLRVKDIVLS